METKNPGAAVQATTRAPKDDLAITSEDNTRNYQAQRLSGRYAIAMPMALLIAALHFGEARHD